MEVEETKGAALASAPPKHPQMATRTHNARVRKLASQGGRMLNRAPGARQRPEQALASQIGSATQVVLEIQDSALDGVVEARRQFLHASTFESQHCC